MLFRSRIVAVDTPAGMAGRAGGGQRMRFRPSAPVADEALLALASVASVSRHGGQLALVGGPEMVQEVTSFLARNQIIAAELRFEQTSLDDAFIALTGHAAGHQATDQHAADHAVEN